MLEAYLVGGLRSPFGRHGGELAGVRADDLAAMVIKAVVEKYGVNPATVEDVVLGCSNQAGEDSRNVARHASLLAGLPVEVGGVSVNRLCGSGLAAIVDAARAVTCGEGAVILAGGVENMSRAPFVLAKAESAYSREAKIFDTTLGARFPNPKITAQYGAHTMPETGDEVARELGITRAEADAFAAGSQFKFERARKSGFFDDEIFPISLAPAKVGAAAEIISADSHPRPTSDVAALTKLKSLFSGGVVTAGNASGINDGAAITLLTSLKKCSDLGRKPLAKIVASAVAGVEPRVMGLGPVFAIRKLLAMTGLELNKIDVIEINEAFAPQVLGCLKMLEIPFDDSRINPHGGAIAVGHPLGASGARLALTASRQLHLGQMRFAIVSLCIGVGQGIAVLLERFE